MSNFSIDDHIKEMVLSSEPEEKARQCKTSRGQQRPVLRSLYNDNTCRSLNYCSNT